MNRGLYYAEDYGITWKFYLIAVWTGTEQQENITIGANYYDRH